ncbi:DUF2530 domain-containing protein [Dermacoccaceae bacterium W4C1]
MSTPAREPAEARRAPAPVKADTVQMVEIGIGIWAVVLVVMLLVPALREGDRSWWPWVPVAGMILGAVGRFYLNRGRGNAVDA